MKLLPIKLPEEMYNQLQTYAQMVNKPMSEIIRQQVKKVAKKAKIRLNLIDWMKKNTIKAKDQFPQLSHDEILYGKNSR